MMDTGSQGEREAEHALIERIKKGDEQAFRELVRKHMEKAVQVAYNAVGNYEDARDIAQDAFIKVHKAIGNFDGQSKFSTWFYRILMNTAKDFHRKKKWKTFLSWQSSEEQDRYLEQLKSKAPGAESGAMRQELQQQMQKAITQLPDQQRWVFTLRYIEGMSIREIEQVTGLSGGTVKSTLHFAAQKFKKTMDSYI